MITLTLDYREVLWWMQGGMAGSHLRWSVYEDMVNKVWPQCSEQERRNLWLIMRRDLGSYWRPDGWSGFDLANAHGEGDWKPLKGYTIDREDADGKPVAYIMDETPWMYFRQVLARFDPENQYAVTIKFQSAKARDYELSSVARASIIRYKEKGYRNAVTVRAYKWDNEYRIDWHRRCSEDAIVKVEKLTIPDDGTM